MQLLISLDIFILEILQEVTEFHLCEGAEFVYNVSTSEEFCESSKCNFGMAREPLQCVFS